MPTDSGVSGRGLLAADSKACWDSLSGQRHKKNGNLPESRACPHP